MSAAETVATNGLATSVTGQIARFVVDTDLADIPASVVEAAKLRILDTLAATLAGSHEECSRMAVEVVGDLGSKPESSILGSRTKAAAPYAAFATAVSASALEYDDNFVSSLGTVANHVSGCVLSACLPVAEARTRSGADALLAYILGYESEARLTLGCANAPHKRGFHAVALFGPFGAAVAAGKLLGLGIEPVRHAMGYAGQTAGSIRKNVGTMAKPFGAGNAARNGVLAAYLAGKGFRANMDVLEGVAGIGHDHFGFCEAFAGPENSDFALMVQNLGSDWELPYTITKHYPTGYRAMPFELTLALVNEYDIKPEDVEKVEVGLTSRWNLGPTYRHPSSGLQARWSMWYQVALCIIDRGLGLPQLTDERIRRADVASFSEKVYPFHDPECEDASKSGNDPMGAATKVTIFLKDGRQLSRKGQLAPGHLGNPSGWDDIAKKLRECVEYSGLLSRGFSVERVVDEVGALDRSASILTLLAALTE